MKPLGKKVVIKPEEKEEVTSSGIHITNAHTAKQASGVIVEVAEEVTEVKVGDKVYYSPLLFEEIEHGEEKFHIIEEMDIHAIIS